MLKIEHNGNVLPRFRNNHHFSMVWIVLVIGLLLFPVLSKAISLQVGVNPSNCPSSGRINFTVGNLMPGSPGPIGIPPSVVFHIWNTSGLTIAGSTSHTSYATAYTTSDISLGGLAAGSYTVRAVESYRSATASSVDVVAAVIDGFGETPEFSVSVADDYCIVDGVITATVVQGTLTQFRLINAMSGAVVNDWQSGGTFTGLPVGSYIVQGRDNCASPTVKVKGTYQIRARENRVAAVTQGTLTSCNGYTFHAGLRNLDQWLSFPVNLTYSISENGIPIVSNTAISFDAPAGISLLREKWLDIPFAGYDPTKSYTFTATGTDGCGKPLSWGYSLAAAMPFEATLKQNCSVITLSDLKNFVGPVNWEFTTYPAGFTPVTGSASPDESGFYHTFSGLPVGDFSLTLTDACGKTVTKTLNVSEGCVQACVGNVAYIVRQQILENCSGETLLMLVFGASGNSGGWGRPYKVELISAPAAYAAGSFPVDVSQYLKNENINFLFPTPVPGNYSFKIYNLGTNCTVPYEFIRNATVGTVKFDDFIIGQTPSCGVSSIEYSYNYNATGVSMSVATLERKSGNTWVWVRNAPASSASGVFDNIDVAGIYRVKVRKVFDSGPWDKINLCPNFEYSNELVITGSTFPTFKEAYGMACANIPNTKAVVVGGQNGKPWPEGYKYKITHYNGVAYNSGSTGYNADYSEYDFRQNFTLPDGTYIFSLIDVCGNEISRELDVSALGIPKVRNTIVCEGGENSLVLAVDAFEQIGYKWFKVVGAVGGPDDFLVSTSNEIRFTPLNAGHAGDYYIQLSLPGGSCEIANIPYTVNLGTTPVAGTTNFACTETGKIVDVSDPAFSLNDLLNGDGNTGGTWTSTSVTTSSGWSGSTFTPSESQMGTFTFAYTVQGVLAGTCGAIPSSSVCVKITITNRALPVSLVSFTVVRETEGASTRSGTALLKWKTTQEKNADKFEIYRSSDARNWAMIGGKQSAVNSVVVQEYQFRDESPIYGTNYYRIKCIDKDGSYALSTIKSLNMEGEISDILIYPNPVATGTLTVGVSSEANISTIEMYNLAGVKVYSSDSKAITNTIITKNFTPGLYLLRVVANDGSSVTKKVIVEK